MIVKSVFIVSIFILNTSLCKSEEIISITKDGITLKVTLESQKLEIVVYDKINQKLSGQIGINERDSVTQCDGLSNCVLIGDSRLHITTNVDNGFAIFWTSNNIKKVFEDCFNLEPFHWYGGPERYTQVWPIEKLILSNFANVLQVTELGAVAEPYWLNSAGAYVYVNDKIPLFINQNTATSQKKVCFSAKIESPYSPKRQKVALHYTIAVLENAKTAHLHAVKHFLGYPSGHPNYKIIEWPIWSTWARYKKNINDNVVRTFAQEIADNGYSNGQFEIDDEWEDCYGELTFTASKFSGIDETVAFIKSLGFTVTLWVHPFINTNCKKYVETARKYGFLVKDVNGNDLTQWWNSDNLGATHLDFTNAEAREWFIERLRALKEAHGIDGFKFDAGETNWAPTTSQLSGDVEAIPNSLSIDYARTCAQFGDLIEIRIGYRTQELPVFIRMLDKDSNWGSRNGLYTLITTLLQMNLNGYSMVLPDMVGGNGYNGAPSAELFIRWLQANVFMPTIQFSYVPWDYSETAYNVSEISKKLVKLHQKVAPYIKEQMENRMKNGAPVNSPIWWISPNDPKALEMDTEFLLGEDILVAPVITPGAKSRDIYLPKGVWIDGNTGNVHEGPTELLNYNAPIDVLPYFVRKGSLDSLMIDNSGR